jgi:hypothetical protein
MKLTLLLIISLAALFTGCKKGKDDPFLSLRSRKARVTGDWTVTSGTSTYVYSSGNYSRTSTFTYSETSYSYVHNENGIITTGGGSSKITMKFEKDGKFRSTNTGDGSTGTSEGTWNFTDGIGDAKKKEQIVVRLSSGSNTGSTINTSYTYTGNETDITMNLKELRNKKMVIIMESGYTSSSGTKDIKTDEYTLEQK